jgi:hypothetical protein
MLHGIMIAAPAFPVWSDFAALVAHLQFVRDHHRNVQRVAVVSDSGFLTVAPRVADHFVHAEVRHFSEADRDAAIAWLRAER